MPRFIAIAFAVLCSAALPCAAQQLLPQSFAGWTRTSASPVSAGSARPDQSILNEYGYSGLESATFTRDGAVIEAAVYRMKDPSGAYGLYSYLRMPRMTKADFTEHSSSSPERDLILAGNLVLDVSGKGLASRAADVQRLVSAVGSHAEDGTLPSLWERLPEDNIVEGTDRYILGPQTLNQLFPGGLGDSMRFAAGAEAETAHYRLSGSDVTLLLADFPTPQLAEDTLRVLQKKFNVNGSNSVANSPALFAKRKLTLLAIVAGAASQNDANTLLGQVQSGTTLTWNEPTLHFKEPTIEVMVVGAFVGTGAICGFTLVAGLAFGGFRLFIKRLLPGKVFDRGAQLQVLQLGLSSKPINAEDFYAGPSGPIPDVKVDKNLPDRVALRIFR